MVGGRDHIRVVQQIIEFDIFNNRTWLSFDIIMNVLYAIWHPRQCPSDGWAGGGGRGDGGGVADPGPAVVARRGRPRPGGCDTLVFSPDPGGMRRACMRRICMYTSCVILLVQNGKPATREGIAPESGECGGGEGEVGGGLP